MVFTGMSGAIGRAGWLDQHTPAVLVDITVRRVVVFHFRVGSVGRVGEVLVKNTRGNDYGAVRTDGAVRAAGPDYDKI